MKISKIFGAFAVDLPVVRSYNAQTRFSDTCVATCCCSERPARNVCFLMLSCNERVSASSFYKGHKYSCSLM